MKTIRAFAFIAFFSLTALNISAQLTNGINYQAILRDAQGDPRMNYSTTILFQVRQGSSVGPIVFNDTHNAMTNEHGLVNLVIGKGTTVVGDIATLDYANDDYFLQVFIDGVGTPNQRLEAVPMSYKATDMVLGDITDVDGSAASSGQVLQWDGTEWTPATISGGGVWTLVGSDATFTDGKVGIGLTTPQSLLHMHRPSNGIQPILQLTNSSSGSLSTAGFQIRFETGQEAQLRQREYGALTLWTNDIERINIAANGKIGINRIGVLGSSDLTLRSLNSSGYGGMYVESPSATNGQPFYGYASDGMTRAWHYFDEGQDQWRLVVDGTQLITVEGDEQNIGFNTTSPDGSALLDLFSYNKGFLLPRLTSAQRTAIASPAEALMLYDTDLDVTMQYIGGTWQALGSGGGGVSHWTENYSFGIEYTANNVGIGSNASPFHRLFLTTGSGIPVGIDVTNGYTGGAAKYGVNAFVSNSGTGQRFALRGVASAPSSQSDAAYGVYGTASASTSTSDVYGVYGLAGVTNGGTGYGVYGEANSADNVGVFGYNSDLSGLAAQFDGKVLLNGSNSDLSVNEEFIVHPTWTNGSVKVDMYNDQNVKTVQIYAEGTQGGGARMWLADYTGVNRIVLNVNSSGIGRITTDELKINGGADLAEYFSTSNEEHTIEPGNVVVIDEEAPGKVHISQKEYDNKVVGIVSGAKGIKSGMLMGQEDSEAYGNLPVAIAGRVYVKTTDSNGKIQPGDLLTTSSDPGTAMKVIDWVAARGAIIGKALSRADENGFVLVLVNLQ